MTESSVLSLPTHLLVLFNYISTLKLSSTRPLFPLLTPLSFPLSLPFQLTQSILFASYYNNITYTLFQPYNTQLTFSTFDLSLSFFIFTSIQGIILEVMVANTPSSKSTSTGSQLQILYITSMPHPGSLGSLFFEVANISKFTERFENMCDDYHMSIFEKISCLLWYCELFTARHVRSIIGFSRLD